MIASLFPLAIFFLAIGIPVFLALLIPSFIMLHQGFPHMELDILLQQMVGGVNSFSILAIPFFIFAADIISKGQIGRKLVNLANTLVGHFTGGLAMATVVTCLFFGAISGAGSAAVVAIGSLVYQPLLEKGYKKSFILGLILASSSLAMLIPPSIAMILFSTVAPEASVRKLFTGGLVLGILVGITFCIYSYVYAKRHNIPKEEFVGFKNVGKAFMEAGWSLGLPIVILSGIYLGITTITEAAVIAVAYAAFIEMVIYRGVKLNDLWEISSKSGLIITMLLVLIAAGKAISYVMTVAGLPALITQIFGDFSVIMVLLLITVIFLIAGMFIDPNSAVIILVPLITPVAFSLGIDPIHLGLIVTLNLTIGMITPPVGLNIFIAQGTFKVPYGEIVPGLVPFVILSLLILLLATYVPGLVTWFPNMLN